MITSILHHFAPFMLHIWTDFCMAVYWTTHQWCQSSTLSWSRVNSLWLRSKDGVGMFFLLFYSRVVWGAEVTKSGYWSRSDGRSYRNWTRYRTVHLSSNAVLILLLDPAPPSGVVLRTINSINFSKTLFGGSRYIQIDSDECKSNAYSRSAKERCKCRGRS